MKNIDIIPKILFCEISPKSILTGKISSFHFPKKDFEALARKEMKHLTETEISEIFHYFLSHLSGASNQSGLDVFQMLKYVTQEMLLIRENQPECRYKEILRWRGLVRNLGEDLPVCAYLAYVTEEKGISWTDFEWDPVISHDNMQLKRIMQRGITDNHFHLFGSAPAFRLSWINLMNLPADSRYVRQLKKLDASGRVQHVHYQRDYGEDSREILLFQAALIRMVLFWYLRLAENGNSDEMNALMRKTAYIQRLLMNSSGLAIEKNQLQIKINQLRTITSAGKEKNEVDYALYDCGQRGINHDFEGERKLLYQMLIGRIGHYPIPEILMNWFYAYLVIKGRFYEEMVQINENIGFENFSRYTDNRYGFLLDSSDTENMVRHAVVGTWNSGNIKGLEIRITPKLSVGDNRAMIRFYDSCIQSRLPQTAFQQIYYVFHFPKKPDKELLEQHGLVYNYRHRSYREKLRKQGESLLLFREKAPKEAARVLGIDACAMEIGCRPEVFGPVFRKLTAHVMPVPNIYGVRQWKLTYHVGEDFLDLADGLRAIDEAVLFLNMKNGDRLGHAMALGQNVQKWYEYKHNEIILPVQDYLDNVVWLYHKLIEFNIQACETLKGYLCIQFEKYFHEIYGRFLDKRLIEGVSERMRKYAVDSEPYTIFNISVYYDAWKLRGNDPMLYEKGYYENKISDLEPYLENRLVGIKSSDEKTIKADILYFYYHYSAEVRHAGEKKMLITVPDIYVNGVQEVQRAMQQYVADSGICIEANPSSNYLISTMQKYEDHPISNLFNMGLTVDSKEIAESPQMHISINTDDRGVFHTSLENEYALMGCAIEQVMDVNGKRKYQRQMVYDWLDRIREFGNQQSFSNEGGMADVD